MRIVVTGGCGFIGSHLVEALVRSGDDVVVVDNLHSGDLNNIKSVLSDVCFENHCITDFDCMMRVCKGADVVIHLAAISSVQESMLDPYATAWVNTWGARVVAEAAKLNGAKFIFASSCSVYGDGEPPYHVGGPVHPISPYARQKLAAEFLCGGAIFRLFNVYGPRQSLDYGAVIPTFRERIKNNRPVTVFGGEQTRDFVYVGDVVSILERAAHDFEEQTLNVGTGVPTKIRDLPFLWSDCPSVRIEGPREGDPKDAWDGVVNWVCSSIQNGMDKWGAWEKQYGG